MKLGETNYTPASGSEINLARQNIQRALAPDAGFKQAHQR